MQDARTAINRAARESVSASWVPFGNASRSVVQQIEAMGKQSRRVHQTPELSFTLGGLSELFDPETRCLIAIDSLGKVHGIVSWLPVFRDGAVVGWTLDFMRRAIDGLKGVMDFLIATSALSFKAEGFEFVSLSGVPLPVDARNGPATLMDPALHALGTALNRIFGFDTLLAFKDKFRPIYQALYLAYRDGMDLPRIACSIGRAYLPGLTMRQAIGVGRSALLARSCRDSVEDRLGVMAEVTTSVLTESSELT
jgi:lysylphosphatidylglycerol synthetase-like protein (DUF2156 family)